MIQGTVSPNRQPIVRFVVRGPLPVYEIEYAADSAQEEFEQAYLWRSEITLSEAAAQWAEGLRRLVAAMKNDAVPDVRREAVRREAVHSLGCDDCKTNALCTDTIPLLHSDPAYKTAYNVSYTSNYGPPFWTLCL